MNYQRIFDIIGWSIVVVCIIVGLITPLYLYSISPDEKEIEIPLYPGEIPPNTVRVFNIEDVETRGEINQVLGTYDFYQCDQTYSFVSLDRQNNVVEIFVRGTTSNETFDYQLQKEIPYVYEHEIIAYSADDIISFNDKNIVVECYKDTSGAFMCFLIGVVLAVIMGIVSFLLMLRLEGFLKQVCKKAKPYVKREERK